MTKRISGAIDTEDWHIHAFIDWVPQNHSEECTRCGGSGEVGGGFKDLDGPQTCPCCHGSGSVLKGPTTEKPETPPQLIEHMRRAWFDYFHKDQS